MTSQKYLRRVGRIRANVLSANRFINTIRTELDSRPADRNDEHRIRDVYNYSRKWQEAYDKWMKEWENQVEKLPDDAKKELETAILEDWQANGEYHDLDLLLDLQHEACMLLLAVAAQLEHNTWMVKVNKNSTQPTEKTRTRTTWNKNTSQSLSTEENKTSTNSAESKSKQMETFSSNQGAPVQMASVQMSASNQYYGPNEGHKQLMPKLQLWKTAKRSKKKRKHQGSTATMNEQQSNETPSEMESASSSPSMAMANSSSSPSMAMANSTSSPSMAMANSTSNPSMVMVTSESSTVMISQHSQRQNQAQKYVSFFQRPKFTHLTAQQANQGAPRIHRQFFRFKNKESPPATTSLDFHFHPSNDESQGTVKHQGTLQFVEPVADGATNSKISIMEQFNQRKHKPDDWMFENSPRNMVMEENRVQHKWKHTQHGRNWNLQLEPKNKWKEKLWNLPPARNTWKEHYRDENGLLG